MGRSQVAYNQKRSGRGRGRGRSSNDRQAASRASKPSPTAPLPQQQQPFVPRLDNAPSVAEQAEHFLSLGSATSNNAALQKNNTKNDFVFHADAGSALDPSRLASALHSTYSRSELLRLPTHIISHVYGKTAAAAEMSSPVVVPSPTNNATTTLIDVTGMQEEDDHATVPAAGNITLQPKATTVVEDDDDDEDVDDENCVVYLGTKQPSADPNNEDDLDDWLDSVIS